MSQFGLAPPRTANHQRCSSRLTLRGMTRFWMCSCSSSVRSNPRGRQTYPLETEPNGFTNPVSRPATSARVPSVSKWQRGLLPRCSFLPSSGNRFSMVHGLPTTASRHGSKATPCVTAHLQVHPVCETVRRSATSLGRPSLSAKVVRCPVVGRSWLFALVESKTLMANRDRTVWCAVKSLHMTSTMYARHRNRRQDRR